jgi:exodeoxyribonuclease-1
MKYVFYDTETTGTATAFDHILQFAAVLTNEDLQELDRYEVRSRLDAHVIAHPGALLTNRISVERLLDPSLPSNYEMVCQIRKQLTEWSPAIFIGYNSLKFDEEILRQAFFKALHPPYLTAKFGNGRADAMTLVKIATAFVPECLAIPCNEGGNQVFKLDQVAPANGFNHENAHDALGDVLATIHLARCVKERAPECWKRFLQFSRKAAVAEFIETEAAFLLTEFYWKPKAYHYPVAYVATDPESANVKVCLDVRNDPLWLATLTDSQLVAFANKSPKPLRSVRTNSSPLIANLDDVPADALHGFSTELLRARAEQLRADGELQLRLMETFGNIKTAYEESDHWEEKMDIFHAVAWPERGPIVESFSDDRLRHFGRRLLHAHCREALSPEICAEIDNLIAGRLLDELPPKDKWTSIPMALAAAAAMLEGATEEDAQLLSGYTAYLSIRLAELQAVAA